MRMCIFFTTFAHALRNKAHRMQIGELEHLLGLHPEVEVLAKELSKKREKHFLLKDLHASAQSIILHALSKRLAQKQHARHMLILLDNNDEAQYMYADLRTLAQEKNVYFFPSSHRRRQGTDEAMAIQRTEVLNALLVESRMSNVESQGGSVAPIIVTYPEALAETVPQPTLLQQQTIAIAVEQEIPQSELINQLLALDFQRVDFVYEPGQFAVRGGIIDIYSYAHDNPYRLDFF